MECGTCNRFQIRRCVLEPPWPNSAVPRFEQHFQSPCHVRSSESSRSLSPVRMSRVTPLSQPGLLLPGSVLFRLERDACGRDDGNHVSRSDGAIGSTLALTSERCTRCRKARVALTSDRSFQAPFQMLGCLRESVPMALIPRWGIKRIVWDYGSD
jgi:hypothetical protein